MVNELPFMDIENRKLVGKYVVLSYGAYNAFGLIGTELAGVALCMRDGDKGCIIATKTIPYNKVKRAKEFEEATKTDDFISNIKALQGWDWRFDPRKDEAFLKSIKRKSTEKIAEEIDSSRLEKINKAYFLSKLNLFAKRLVKIIGFKPESFEIRIMKGGPACRGEVVIHSDEWYIMLGGDMNHQVMYRRCDGREDYIGKTNIFCSSVELVQRAKKGLFENKPQVMEEVQ